VSESGVTIGELVLFCQNIEERATAAYQALSVAHPAHASCFSEWAQQSELAASLVEHSYRDTANSAQEAEAAVATWRLEDYACSWPVENARLNRALAACAACEAVSARFYLQAASDFEPRLPGIVAVLRRISRMHGRRAAAVQTLLEELS